MMKNSPNYEILSNPAYVTAFQYTPIQQRDNVEESSTSDMVTSMLYFSFRKENFETPLMKLAGTAHKKHATRRILKKAAAQQVLADTE